MIIARRELLGAVAACCATSTEAWAANWPQFRGLQGRGISDEPRAPRLQWSDAEGVRWKTPLPGPGASSPVVWNDRLFVTCYTGYGDGVGQDPSSLERRLVCVARKNGSILWQRSVPARRPEDPYDGYIKEHGYASSTPATDGTRIFTFYGKSGVVAFDFAGKQLWQTEVGTNSGTQKWGSASSPVLHKSLVIVNAGDESRSIRALDQKTGKPVWTLEDPQLDQAYNTPILVQTRRGRTELVQPVGGAIWGIDPESGKRLWTVKTPTNGNISPSAVADGEMIYSLGGFPNTGMMAVRCGGDGDVTQSHLLWTSRSTSYIPSAVAVGGNLYWVSERPAALCLDAATGKQVYEERLGEGSGGGPGMYASVTLAAGRLYAVTRTGGTYVLAAQPMFKVLAHNKLESDKSQFNGSPAVSDGELFLRSNKFLYCIGGR
jgi:outer membrane protein assembly factor BamB